MMVKTMHKVKTKTTIGSHRGFVSISFKYVNKNEHFNKRIVSSTQKLNLLSRFGTLIRRDGFVL